MSKVLKFIVNLVVLLSIVVAVALLVPPLLGVDTVINDNSNIETNLPYKEFYLLFSAFPYLLVCRKQPLPQEGWFLYSSYHL